MFPYVILGHFDLKHFQLPVGLLENIKPNEDLPYLIEMTALKASVLVFIIAFKHKTLQNTETHCAECCVLAVMVLLTMGSYI